ncbi:MAG TPA: PKD domain-containing protein, partial [Thermoplasmatales archaeon]|nr:PKD domain-containing protein [Thermoplasmatales archaeon]
LTIEDNDGATSQKTKTITITNTPPKANFTWTPTNPIQGDEVYFTSTANDIDGVIINYTWNFGDGNTSHEQNPTHQYKDNGTYTVTLTIKDDDNATYSISKDLTVINIPPMADFTWDPTEPYTNTTVNFTDLSIDSDGSIINWTWDFGDGNISYEQNPSHIYTKNGTYNVTLTVTDDDGAVNSTTKTINVIIHNIPPVAKFDFCPHPPKVNISVLFLDQSYDPDGHIVNWTWDFGDGNISYERYPRHTYTETGEYTVNLTIRDNLGAVAWYKRVLNVTT